MSITPSPLLTYCGVQVAGSHKANLVPPQGLYDYDAHQELVTELHGKAGDAIIFSETCEYRHKRLSSSALSTTTPYAVADIAMLHCCRHTRDAALACRSPAARGPLQILALPYELRRRRLPGRARFTPPQSCTASAGLVW